MITSICIKSKYSEMLVMPSWAVSSKEINNVIQICTFLLNLNIPFDRQFRSPSLLSNMRISENIVIHNLCTSQHIVIVQYQI